jgi:hypothetical protein
MPRQSGHHSLLGRLVGYDVDRTDQLRSVTGVAQSIAYLPTAGAEDSAKTRRAIGRS